ncbi:STAS-like domain-containing protein [Providencia sp. Je.9.19]|uniref:STAS-like domain-containing protein n=1 Tax=Providencia sp. Je.9.19 TaxID=3142844 RepID=UPI003DA97C9E
MKTIYIKDFSRFPGPRYKNLGEFSGEEFRDDILIPEIEKNNGDIEVNLDGVFGYGSSFLEETFGGLARHGVDKNLILKLRDNITSNDESIKQEVISYINDSL